MCSILRPNQSFALVTTLLVTILEFLALLLFHRAGLNYISMGPSALVFGILHQHSRIVPAAYHYRIFGVSLNNKSVTFILALQVSQGIISSVLSQ